MMMANEVATYYRMEDGESISKIMLNGITWHEISVSAATDKGLQINKEIVMRIPLESMPGNFIPKADDMMVHGVCNLDVGCSDVSLISASAVTVKSVANNTHGLGAHWELEAV